MNRDAVLTSLAEEVRPAVAAAMDEGLTSREIVAVLRDVVDAEVHDRTQATAAKLYGPAAKALDASPAAVALVAKAKLPQGQYAIARPVEVAPRHKGAAARAVTAALATGETCRLYRLADGWRFVGIVHPNGRFTDERASS